MWNVTDSKSKSVSENLKMNSALLSRFDLVFIILDRPDRDMDKFLSEHIMKVNYVWMIRVAPFWEIQTFESRSWKKTSL